MYYNNIALRIEIFKKKRAVLRVQDWLSFFMRKICASYADSMRIVYIQQKVYKMTKKPVIICAIRQ